MSLQLQLLEIYDTDSRQNRVCRDNSSVTSLSVRNFSPCPQSETLEMAAEVVAAFVSNNPLPRGALPALIQAIHDTLAELSAGVEISTPKEEPKEPAVSIRKSVTPGYLICLEDGKHFKALKRHLAAHGLTPEQYRAKWKLPLRLSHGCRQLRGRVGRR